MVKSLVDDIVNNMSILEQLPKIINDEVSRLDREQQDVLHSIEFSRFNVCDGYKLSKRIQDIRVARREYKNLQEEVQKVQSVLGQHKAFKGALGKSINNIDKVNNIQDKRVYTARVIDQNDELAKLRSVNKTGIKFKPSPHMDRLNALYRQIEEGKIKQ